MRQPNPLNIKGTTFRATDFTIKDLFRIIPWFIRVYKWRVQTKQAGEKPPDFEE